MMLFIVQNSVAQVTWCQTKKSDLVHQKSHQTTLYSDSAQNNKKDSKNQLIQNGVQLATDKKEKTPCLHCDRWLNGGIKSC